MRWFGTRHSGATTRSCQVSPGILAPGEFGKRLSGWTVARGACCADLGSENPAKNAKPVRRAAGITVEIVGLGKSTWYGEQV